MDIEISAFLIISIGAFAILALVIYEDIDRNSRPGPRSTYDANQRAKNRTHP